MKDWLRRVRGALGIGLTWAVAWAPIGAVLGAVLAVVLPQPALGVAAAAALNAKVFAALGFVGGGVFSAVLAASEGRRSFDQLSARRLAALGAVGGLLLGGATVGLGLWGPGLQAVDAAIVAAATFLSGASAAATLAIARRTLDRDALDGSDTPPSLPAGRDRPRVGAGR